ncbi:sperm-associated microtubule inner protein 4 [Aplochiton taeniatus]
MASVCRRNPPTPAVIKGHRHFSYGGAVVPENVTIRQFYDLTPTKKSNVRLNDQLIPKPTDINIAEKKIKVPIQKEHPYQSHISRFAMFPTIHSPDDPDTGIRAASQNPLHPHIPSSAPEVTVLRQTKGGPYRHEIVELPMTTREKAMAWPGQHGFLDYIKPVKEKSQVFYPNPQKTVFPNPTQRDVALSERTANMLKNVERSNWVTSYQLNFTGSGPANPLSMDDFNNKTLALITGEITPHIGNLRERSHNVFRASKPLHGRGSRKHQERQALENNYIPEPPEASMPDQSMQKPTPLKETVSNLDCIKQSSQNQSGPNCSPIEAGPLTTLSRNVSGPDAVSEEVKQNHIPRYDKSGRVEVAPLTQSSLTLLELQNSFSKTEAQHRFRNSIQGPTMDLRDNIHSGKKHNFYGLNCYYYH